MVNSVRRAFYLPFVALNMNKTEILFAKAEVKSDLSGGIVAYKRYLINEAAWENPTGIDILEIPKIEVNPTTTTDTLTSIKINGVSYAISGANVDLSNYYTKAETYSKAEVDSLIPDTSRFITEIPAEYVTETELNAKGYLTEHQSLEGYATEKYVDDAIAAIPGTDLSNYYTKTEVDTADSKLQLDIDNLEYHIQNITDPTLALKADKTYVDNQIASFVTMEQVNTAIETALNNIPTAEGGAY